LVKTESDRLCLRYLSITLSVFCSPVHHVLTFAHDHERLVHAILGVRASLLFLAGGRIPRVAWTRRRPSHETVKKRYRASSAALLFGIDIETTRQSEAD
jgi:hypothetical protein